ncbi:MAG: B12-binding domain-containing radical SAM protein [Elusimicrobiota bacterium]
MKFLLINPYACDFACYDYWLKPLGLLYISSILKNMGHEVFFIDCLAHNTGEGKYGKGNFYSEKRKKPQALRKYKRKYRNFGLFGQRLYHKMKSLPQPDIILLSTSMTYWYPAASETALMARKVFPSAKIAAGGNYVTFCPRHARNNIDADYFFTGASLKEFFKFIESRPITFQDWPSPDYSHYKNISYAVTRTSAGCMNNCPYCGIKQMWDRYMRRPPKKIKTELTRLRKQGIRDIVFYDDALLENSFLEKSLSGLPPGIRFHTPNGLNLRCINPKKALLMKKNNFISPMLAVDSIGEEKQSKASPKVIENAIANLYSAHYTKGEIGAYLILGLPGQKLSKITRDAIFLHKLGVKIMLAEYSPVPGSGYESKTSKEVLAEPLLQNNSLFPCLNEKWEDIFALKRFVSNLNKKITCPHI